MEKELLTVCTEEDLQNGLIDENGGIYSPDGSRFLKFTGNGEEYTVKEGVEVICEKAFYNPRANSKSNSLKKISLPDSCKKNR